MKKEKINTSLKSKIALGYLFIFVASFLAVLFLYKGIQKLHEVDQKYTIPNEKLHTINRIITLIYDAENKTRSYFLLRNKNYFKEYAYVLDSIGNNIDSLKKICRDNPEEISKLNMIMSLLDQKKDVVKQLSELKSNRRRDKMYDRALEEVYIQAYELSKLPRIVQEKIIITRDSLLSEPEKRTLLQRIFSREKPQNNKPRTVVENSTKSDTVLQEGISTDSVVNTLQRALLNLKLREDYLRDLSQNSEIKLLYNDQVLLDKIREIATLLESDEIVRINQALGKSSGILQEASDGAFLLILLSVIIIIVFLILTFNDIKAAKRHQLALQTAKQQTEELMKLKEQFLANMSHEIRTPLSTIIGFTEQLLKTGLNSQQKLFASTIDKASDHLLDVVNDILDLSKIEAGKFLLEKEPFNLFEVIKESCDSFSLHAKEKNLTLQYKIDPDLNRELSGDPFRIRQVLINIISNAIKFTDKGEIDVTAKIMSHNEKYMTARISITDTGIGIAPDKQKAIFEDFSQADTGISRKYGGTGLGLSISRRIIILHGGTINVESTPGKGSTFSIILPLEIPQKKLAVMAPLQAENIPTVPKKNSLKGKKILVVEDDEVTLMLINSLLKDTEAKAEAMTDSSKALQTARKNQFDLIITDINMPQVSGIEFIRAIRSESDPDISRVPVIAMTAYVSDSRKLLEDGFTDYLTKPFKENAFYNKVSFVLNHATAHGSDFPNVTEKTWNYSLNEVYQFTGDDHDALRLVVSTFVEKSMAALKEMKEHAKKNELENISFLAHRLLPTFRQFGILEIVPLLEKLERYKELNLPREQLLKITSEIIPAAEKVVKQIESEVVIQKMA